MSDPVNHPSHYQSASGFECIQFTSLLTFELGNALKYLWRAGRKDGVSCHQDIEKALTYVRMSRIETTCPLSGVRDEVFDLVDRALKVSLPEERRAAGHWILCLARGTLGSKLVVERVLQDLYALAVDNEVEAQ